MSAVPGKPVASVASVLKASEVADLIAIARALPDDWCVQVRPPHGQIAVCPLATRERSHRCWTAAVAWGAIRRESGILRTSL